MSETSTPPQNSRGLTAGFLSFWGSAGRHVLAVVELAGIESKEAIALYVRLAVMLVAALIFLIFGYFLALLFVVFLIATIFGISWLWIFLGLALLHFLLAFVCATHVRTHLKTPVFASTSAEIRKDLESLKSVKP
ncbi:MAG: phage holin family protein [Terrimicrobiaceae bacterium]